MMSGVFALTEAEVEEAVMPNPFSEGIEAASRLDVRPSAGVAELEPEASAKGENVYPRLIITTRTGRLEEHAFPVDLSHSLNFSEALCLPHGISPVPIFRDIFVHMEFKSERSTVRDTFRNFLFSKPVEAFYASSFWWFFLDMSSALELPSIHSISNVAKEQEHLFLRMAHSYCAAFLSLDTRSRDPVLKFFPDVVSQSIFTGFTICFPMTKSIFDNDQFKILISRTVSVWMTGMVPPEPAYSHWKSTERIVPTLKRVIQEGKESWKRAKRALQLSNMMKNTASTSDMLSEPVMERRPSRGGSAQSDATGSNRTSSRASGSGDLLSLGDRSLRANMIPRSSVDALSDPSHPDYEEPRRFLNVADNAESEEETKKFAFKKLHKKLKTMEMDEKEKSKSIHNRMYSRSFMGVAASVQPGSATADASSPDPFTSTSPRSTALSPRSVVSAVTIQSQLSVRKPSRPGTSSGVSKWYAAGSTKVFDRPLVKQLYRTETTVFDVYSRSPLVDFFLDKTSPTVQVYPQWRISWVKHIVPKLKTLQAEKEKEMEEAEHPDTSSEATESENGRGEYTEYARHLREQQQGMLQEFRATVRAHDILRKAEKFDNHAFRKQLMMQKQKWIEDVTFKQMRNEERAYRYVGCLMRKIEEAIIADEREDLRSSVQLYTECFAAMEDDGFFFSDDTPSLVSCSTVAQDESLGPKRHSAPRILTMRECWVHVPSPYKDTFFSFAKKYRPRLQFLKAEWAARFQREFAGAVMKAKVETVPDHVFDTLMDGAAPALRARTAPGRSRSPQKGSPLPAVSNVPKFITIRKDTEDDAKPRSPLLSSDPDQAKVFDPEKKKSRAPFFAKVGPLQPVSPKNGPKNLSFDPVKGRAAHPDGMFGKADQKMSEEELLELEAERRDREGTFAFIDRRQNAANEVRSEESDLQSTFRSSSSVASHASSFSGSANSSIRGSAFIKRVLKHNSLL
eukprot:ANDGO_06306.mRNA.1 hypothetical protein